MKRPPEEEAPAKRMYEGAGLGPKDVNRFDPYEGYAPPSLAYGGGKGGGEAIQWHGVKRGDAFAFYAGDIRVERPHPLCLASRIFEMATYLHPSERFFHHSAISGVRAL